jgi:drug/metabolite transporter (DMT)-like permease
MFAATTNKGPSISIKKKTNDTTSMLADPVESTKYERRLAREQEIKSSVNQKKLALNQLLALTLTLVVNLALPLILYYTLRNHIGAVYALLISGIPPLLNVIYKFIRNRKLDGFGILFVAAFVISGVISLITGKLGINRIVK